MQERRSTVRIPYQCRAQCCSSEDFLPRDGLITELSDRGAGLRTRYPLKRESRVTVSFPLPDERDPVIATGVVRWLEAARASSRWHTAGLEWLPLEEATRHRLQRFLSTSARTRLAPHGATRGTRIPPWLQIAVLACGILVAGMLALVVRRLQQEARSLAATVGEREAMVEQGHRRERWLTRELGMARTELSATATHVAQLDQQARQLSAEVERLSGDVTYVELSYQHLREERERLIQRILDLEQARTAQLQDEQIRLVVREAIEARQRAAQVAASRPIISRRAGPRNQGYLVRDGQPALATPTVSIHVHDPQPLQ